MHDLFKELKKLWFSASCKHLSLMNLNNFNSTFSVSEKLFLKNLFVIFGLTSIFCATVILTITLKPKTLPLSFVSYKFIVILFFSCKIILHNLRTESLQQFFFLQKLNKNPQKTKTKPMHCSEDCIQDSKFWKDTWTFVSDGFYYLLRRTVNTLIFITPTVLVLP